MNCKRRINGETLYQIFLRPFTPEGTIAAAEKRLPEVADLGVKILYLCPVAVADNDMAQENWSPRQIASGCNNPCNPYRISDYTKIDPEYGTENDMRSFIRTAHSLGMKVLLDLVYCHAGPSFLKDHPGFAKGLTEYRFPELDFSNPAVCEYLRDNMRYYAFELDADGFRCDMGDKVPLEFWQPAAEELRKIKPDLIMFCEGVPQRDDELQLGVFDLYYNWSWSQIRHEILRTGAEKVSAITGPISTMVFKLECTGVSAGMGTCGMVGPLGVLKEMGFTTYAWMAVVVACIVLPAVLSLLFAAILRKLGWIKEDDLKLAL